MRTKIAGRFVVGYDGADHVAYRDGEVVYEDDRILFVGHGFTGRVDRAIDAGDALVGPGFIDLNALADIDHGILDTFQGPELASGLQWSEDYFLHRRHELFGRDDERFQRRYALMQLLLHGITTALPIAAETYRAWCETYDQLADVAEIAGDLGIRIYLGPAYRSGINVVRADSSRAVLWDEPRGEAGLDDAIRFVRDFDGAHGGRVRGALLPCRIETVTLDILRRTKAAADELGCPVKLHAAQSMVEVQLLKQWYGKTPVGLLHDLGFLGPRTAIPHCLYVAGLNGMPPGELDELAALADSGTTVVHCPIPSSRHGRALDAFDRYRTAGVNLAIGTDMFPPDIVRALDYAGNMAKQKTGDQSAASPADLYRAATLGGARLLGRDDLGRLAPGAKADIVIIDLSDIRTGPIEDPIRTLVLHGSGRDVRTVVVDGRTVVEQGKVPGVDEAAVRRRAQAYFETYCAAYSERDYLRRPPDVLFPPSFRTVEHPRLRKETP